MKLIVPILIFIFSSCWAFEDDYESDNSDDLVVSGGNTDSQVLANIPFSLCIIDSPKIPKDLCPNVSLKLGGAIYNKYITPSSGLDNKSEDWFYDIAEEWLDDVYNNYFFSQWNWQVPTTGQYQKMIDMGLITLQNGQAVWATNSRGEIQRFSYRGFSVTSGQRNASLPRLTTSVFPSSYTGSFYEEKSFSLYAWKNAAAEIWWYIRYKDRDGTLLTPGGHVIKNGGTYTYPRGVSDHQYRACTTASCSGWGTMDFDANYNGRCISAHGAVFNPWTAKSKLANSRTEC